MMTGGLKKIRTFGTLLLLGLSAGLFWGCDSDIDGAAQDGSPLYGSITIAGSEGARALVASELTEATVTVSGYGMDDVSASATLSSLKGSATVNGIKVGANRVVRVESNVTGAVLYELIPQVNTGSNTIPAVTWDTTALGGIYYNLIKAGVDVSSINSSDFTSAIPSDVHASLVDVKQIAADYRAGSLKEASAYKLSTGTVTATVYGYSGKVIQIADPASSAQTAGADGSELSFAGVLPGTWNVYADGSKVAKVKVTGGGSTAVTVGNPLKGKVVIFAKTSVTHIYAWHHNTSKELNGGWPGDGFTDSDCSAYMNDATGYKMLDITESYDAALGTIDFILSNNGSKTPDRNLESGRTATFWWDGTDFYDSDPTTIHLSDDATLASISVNGTAIEGFNANTTAYTTSIASDTTTAEVVAAANDSAATVSISPNGIQSVSEGASRVFTITVTAEDEVTTKTYTVTVSRIAQNDTSLSSIMVNGKPASISGTAATYNASGTEDSFSVTSIEATAVDSSAKISYSATNGSVSANDSSQFTITVENGEKRTTYTLKVSYTKKDKPVSNGQYGTNDKGYGVNKTISSWSDWTEEMQIARGAAYDDPRTWKGHQEVPYDAYALYAAYDDKNLYLMVELTNLADGRATFMNHSYAGSDNAWWDNRDCPLGFIINTGKGNTATAPLIGSASGKPIWDAISFTDSEGFDFLFYGSSKYGYADHKSAFVGVGTPGLFKLNQSTGYFSYDKDYCLSANSGAPGSEVKGTSGISVRYIRKCQVSTTIKFESTPKDNRASSEQTGDDLLASTTYTAVATGDLDMSYWYTIPLATLGIDKAYIESTGIGVRQITPNGGSLMDCLPWDVSMVDVATEACSDDADTSKEKEDVDNITSAQARVGR